MKKYISVLLMFAGVVMLGSVLVPIGISQINQSLRVTDPIIDPTSVVSAASTDPDFTSPSSWFETPTLKASIVSSKVSYYTLSIDRVGIDHVSVEINGEDLKKNAIQYPGTALPGVPGNTVIFGHSTLSQLYKPYDPVSIFNPVVKTKVGDEIVINYDGVTYRYIIRETLIVKPSQVEVLAQHENKYELTLITCTPLGTYLNRFIARAELVN
jgi:sortase A